MQLKYQDQDDIFDVKQLMISMKWSTGADFDLAAMYESKDGQRDLVYFAQLGQADDLLVPKRELGNEKNKPPRF